MLPNAPPDVLVVERLGHEARDPREAPVGERELADPVRALGGDHLLQHRSFSSALASTTRPSVELQADAADEVAVAVQRLVAVDPALGAAPVGAGEDLEAGDVAPPAAEPAARARRARPSGRRPRRATCTRSISSASRRSRVLLQALADLPPARERVLAVEEAGVDDLLPVLLQARGPPRRPSPRCRRGPSVHEKRPSFSFSPRQSSSGRIASPRRMIRAGSTESRARGSVVAMTDTWWSISSTSPRM